MRNRCDRAYRLSAMRRPVSADVLVAIRPPIGRRVVVWAVLLTVVPLTACTGGQFEPRHSPHALHTHAIPPVTSTIPAPDRKLKALVRARLARPLHLPVAHLSSCPATAGRDVSTPQFTGVAVGHGPVKPIIQGVRSDTLAGTSDLVAHTQFPQWMGAKMLWFSVPSYRGPWLIRARRIDGSGPVGVGGPRSQSIFVRGAAPTAPHDYRSMAGSSYVKKPGCYAWQVDGLTFSEVIVVRLVTRG